MAQPEVWIGTSWKMNKTLAEAQAFATPLAQEASDPRIQRFVIPPFTVARDVATQLSDTSIKVGAQNMHWQDAGAWTGEISPTMLIDCGLDMVELGHSERRAHFGETDATIARKVAAALRHGLIPLICVGETREERESGQASTVLETQTRAALGALMPEDRTKPILFAYEPVWAIGEGGTTATPAYADARQAEIGAVAREVLGRSVPCLYGGSVTADTCAELIRCPHVEGLFIGRAAWNVDGYLTILARCSAALDCGEGG